MVSGEGVLFGAIALGLCPMCFSASGDDPQLVAATMAGVVVLLAVTLIVLGGLAGGILSIARRMRMAAAIDEAHASGRTRAEGLR